MVYPSVERRRRSYRDRGPAPPTIIHVPVPAKPGSRDGDLFTMLCGFSASWFVIEGKGGPGSQYALKHQLYAFLHELADKREPA